MKKISYLVIFALVFQCVALYAQPVISVGNHVTRSTLAPKSAVKEVARKAEVRTITLHGNPLMAFVALIEDRMVDIIDTLKAFNSNKKVSFIILLLAYLWYATVKAIINSIFGATASYTGAYIVVGGMVLSVLIVVGGLFFYIFEKVTGKNMLGLGLEQGKYDEKTKKAVESGEPAMERHKEELRRQRALGVDALLPAYSPMSV